MVSLGLSPAASRISLALWTACCAAFLLGYSTASNLRAAALAVSAFELGGGAVAGRALGGGPDGAAKGHFWNGAPGALLVGGTYAEGGALLVVGI